MATTIRACFSEGYMHGRGVYTWSDGTMYEGDFLKNQITGKGKYTWQDGSTYIGDVLNGKRHGFGTFQNAENTISYTGDWYLGHRNGKGRMNYDTEGRSYYEGEWANGIKHGWGMRQYPSGNTYYGMWFNNVRHGEGTMKWLDRDQVYIGQWENGIQHGIGQHIWLLHRVRKSQYSQRNMYSGELVNGKRHGEGTFYYANGAKYEGSWKDNMKNGKGKFTFKNGRIYEGLFENDHIVEYPDFNIDGTMSPDLANIRTRTPVAADNISIHSNDSRNTISPSFHLNIDTLLVTLPSENWEHEVNQVIYAITRHVSALHRIYSFYSTLGYQESPDNTFIMSKMQFWLFLKDIRLHHGKYMLTDMDRVIGANYQKSSFELHNPYERILQRQFVNYLVILAHLLYSEDYFEKKETGPLLEYCFSRLMREKVLCNACKVKSHIYIDTGRAINALVHMDQAYEIYQAVSTPRKHPPKEPVLKMRQFLFLLKDLKLINEDLTPESVVQILASDNPAVSDGEGCYNLELEMTFLEFFEALVGCAERYVTEKVVRDPTTPRHNIFHPQEPVYSSSVSPSQVMSQIVGEEVEGSHINTGSLSQVSHVSPRVTSSTGLKQKSEADLGRAAESAANLVKETTSSRKQSPSTAHSRDSGIGQPEVLNTASATNGHPRLSLKESQIYGQSHVSLPGLGDEPMDNEELIESEVLTKDEEVPLLDEATRKFNFWTHQVHIFFVRKFFRYAEKYIQMKKLMETIRLEESKKRLMAAAEANLTAVVSEEAIQVDSKTSEAEEETHNEDIEQ